jgi:hypothetical protein
MSSIRWIDNQGNLILKAVGNERRGKMTAIAIKDEHPLRMPSFLLSISIKDILKPIQTYLIITPSSG